MLIQTQNTQKVSRFYDKNAGQACMLHTRRKLLHHTLGVRLYGGNSSAWAGVLADEAPPLTPRPPAGDTGPRGPHQPRDRGKPA